jgi:hypothetical protein
VRGEVPAALEAVGRGSGLAGLAIAAAGTTVVACSARPWYAATAELAMLGAAEQRLVAVVPGWAAVPGVLATVAGAVAALLGIGLALDRHPGWTRPVLVAAAVVLTATGTVGQLVRPSLDRFSDGAGALAELRAVRDDLPRGVELTLTVRPGLAATAALVAGIVVLVGVAAARDLDRR